MKKESPAGSGTLLPDAISFSALLSPHSSLPALPTVKVYSLSALYPKQFFQDTPQRLRRFPDNDVHDSPSSLPFAAGQAAGDQQECRQKQQRTRGKKHRDQNAGPQRHRADSQDTASAPSAHPSRLLSWYSIAERPVPGAEEKEETCGPPLRRSLSFLCRRQILRPPLVKLFNMMSY